MTLAEKVPPPGVAASVWGVCACLCAAQAYLCVCPCGVYLCVETASVGGQGECVWGGTGAYLSVCLCVWACL